MLFNYITVSRICIPPDLALWSGGDGTRTRDPLDAIGPPTRRKRRRIGHPEAITVDVRTLMSRTLVPEVVQVYVLITEFLQARLLQCARLGFERPRSGMFTKETPTAPA